MIRDAAVLVVGADGTIGRAVAAELAARGVHAMPTSRRGVPGSLHLDLSSAASSWEFPARASAAVLCAAATGMEYCRARRDDARRVNVIGTVELARRLTAAGKRVVFLSTNLVFDGMTPYVHADAPRCPRTAYGSMKAEAEEAIVALGELATVVRLTKVVDGGMPLLAGWRTALAKGRHIAPFADLPVAPISLQFAAAIIASVSLGIRSGILQISASKDVTYAEIARHLADALSCPRDLVRPVTVAESEIPLEHVPLHTTLHGATLREWCGVDSPDPWSAIAGVLRVDDNPEKARVTPPSLQQ